MPDDRPIGLTVFEKTDSEPLSKRIMLTDGRPVSDGSVCKMAEGLARHAQIAGLHELAPLLAGLTSQHAISLGTIRPEDRPPEDEPIRVVTQKRYEATQATAHRSTKGPRIARTKDFVRYEDGQPALLLIDFDRKGMPDAVEQRIGAAGGFWPMMTDTIPALKGIETVSRASTSAGLVGPDGTPFPNSGGLHVYMAIADGADSARALKVILKRLWLAGLGWHVVSKAGSLLVRSLVDASVGSPERLVFEGPPELRDGLMQDAEARRPQHVPGGVLDTRAALPNLTPQEEDAFKRLIATSARALKPEQRRVIAEIVEAEAETIAKQAEIPIETAREKAREHVRMRLEERMLPPQTSLLFDRVGTVEVGAVMASPETYIGETLADPLEGIEYGPCKAMVMRARDGRGLVIHSFAHGGGIYRLVYDEDTIEAAIDACEPKAVAKRLADMLLQVACEPKSDVEDRLITRAAKRAGCGKTAIKTAIRTAFQKARKEASEAYLERSAAREERPVIRAPKDKAEVVATLKEIESYLAASPNREPPMRGLAGRLVRVREREVPKTLHLLVAERERAEDGGPLMAPPTQTVLADLDEFDAAGLVEEHVGLLHTDCHGNTNFVRLQSHFCHALINYKASVLPVVAGVQALPLVLPNRGLLVQPGLHRDLKLVLRIDPALAAAMPAPEACTLAAARDAFRFLADDVLADVETTREGKIILIALMISVIERHLLDERPAFVITGAQARCGKTTASHIVSMLATGKHAAAAAWSPEEEERRKTLLSQALMNLPLVLWDNIERGAQISCPHLERATTSPTIEDRILGRSEIVVAPATTIHVLTGNRIAPKGDLATRCLVVDLVSRHPDPANRAFRHTNIIDWVQANRLQILQALYTILLVERPDQAGQAATRFKSWWELIGWPLEIVSGVTIAALFDEMVNADESAAAIRTLFEAWWECFGARAVRAADIREMLGGGVRVFEPQDPSTQLREAFFTATGGRPPDYVVLQTVEVGKRLATIAGYVTTIFTGDEMSDVKLEVQPDSKRGNTYVLSLLSGSPPRHA